MKKCICTILVIVAISFAGTITKTFNFSESDLIFDRYNNYIILNLPGLNHTTEVGSPYLPMALYTVLVPPTAEVVSITVEKSENVEIPGVFDVMPVPEYQPISSTTGPIINANHEVYAQNTAYPGRLVDYSRTGSKSGYRLCGFSLYPVQYVPNEKRLIFYRHITVKINYEEGKITPIQLTDLQKEVFEKEIRTIVINPEDISGFAPDLHYVETQCNYLLITTDAFASSFQPLVDWRNKQGYKGEILTMATITSTYPGRDNPEKIRNAIISYFQTRGLIFVVLGGDGDNQYVPKRGVYVSYSGYTETSMPCDLYFSDLTGSWDGDHDNTFGETNDSIDFYPDVYVGRASVSSTAQATTFVNKVLTFEKNPPADYLKRILLPSVMLFASYNWHGHIVNDSIALITPSGWTDRSILDPTSTMPMRDSLDNGFEFCHVPAHGNETGFYTQSGTQIYGVGTANFQTNGNRLFILNSIACLSGSFDYSGGDCLAEAMMHNPNGGAVATIQNSRDGWGAPPILGPSERMDVDFYDFLINRDTFLIGGAHARSKSIHTSQALSDGCWRWCIYELNLFGDPAMPMWTEVPQTMTAQFPQVVPLGPSTFNIQVSRSLGGPVNRALVSVEKGTEVYAQGYTDISGVASIPISPITPGRFYITVTAHNCYPYEDSAMVQSNGAYVAYLRAAMIDSARGNGDGIPNPGEGINMRTWVKNWGNLAATNVIGRLRTTQTCLSILDSVKSFGTISANDSAFTGPNGFDFTIAPACTNGQNIAMLLNCRDALDSTWTSNVFIRVGAPVLVYRNKSVYDPAPGNNNGRLDPGETADLIVTLANQGYGNGYNVVGTLRSYDNRLVVSDSVGSFGTVFHETTGTNQTDRFTLTASSSIAPGTPIPCSLKITASDNYQRTVGFSIVIGEFRTIDPIPDGPRVPVVYWAYDNIDTLYVQRPVYNWVEIKNLSTRITYAQNDQARVIPLPTGFGSLKFYGQRYDSISVSVDGWIACGRDTTHAYSNAQLPSSTARPKMIAANWDDLRESATGGSGAIWSYYNPVNGTFIIEWDSVSYFSVTTTRDKFEVIFYDSTYVTPTGDNTFIVQYMTANLTNSSTIGIQDETQTIGIQYLFNGTYHPAAAGLVAGRAIKYTTAEPITGCKEELFVDISKKPVLFANRPNPFRDQTFINYSINSRGRVALQIYDAAGRLVRTLLNNVQDAGSYTMRWDSKDENGKNVAQGIYFCRLKTNKNTAIRKLAVVK
jgi:hypothetical protein